ncbi:hypothetical protein [Streptomyces sp. NPDC057909]
MRTSLDQHHESARAREAALDAGTTLNYQATSRMSWGEHQITVPKNAHH